MLLFCVLSKFFVAFRYPANPAELAKLIGKINIPYKDQAAPAP